MAESAATLADRETQCIAITIQVDAQKLLRVARRCAFYDRLYALNPPDALLAKDQVAEVRNSARLSPRPRNDGPAMSVAEGRVFQYLPTHLSLAEIADKLYLSRHTVKSHVVAIYRKLDVASRSEAVKAGRDAGWLD